MAIHWSEDDAGQIELDPASVEVTTLEQLKSGLLFWKTRLGERAMRPIEEPEMNLLKRFCRNSCWYYKFFLSQESRDAQGMVLHALGNRLHPFQSFSDGAVELDVLDSCFVKAQDLLDNLGDPDESIPNSAAWLQESLESYLKGLGQGPGFEVSLNGVPPSLKVPNANKVFLIAVNLINNAWKCPGVDFVSCLFDFRQFTDGRNFFEVDVSQEGAGFPADFDFEKAKDLKVKRGERGNGLKDIAQVAEEIGGCFTLEDPKYASFRFSLPLPSDSEGLASQPKTSVVEVLESVSGSHGNKIRGVDSLAGIQTADPESCRALFAEMLRLTVESAPDMNVYGVGLSPAGRKIGQTVEIIWHRDQPIENALKKTWLDFLKSKSLRGGAWVKDRPGQGGKRGFWAELPG
jgi:hypothetical protein